MDRPYPSGGAGTTPTGPYQTRNVRERNTRGQKVDYVATKDTDFPGTKEPKRYMDIADSLTPNAAGAAINEEGYEADTESHGARRAATTMAALSEVSEAQRNGGRKHARAAGRVVAKKVLSPAKVYKDKNPAFPQSAKGGMGLHRDIMAGKKPMTADQVRVVEEFSASSGDEYASMSDQAAIDQYRRRTETKKGRVEMDRQGKVPKPAESLKRKRSGSDDAGRDTARAGTTFGSDSPGQHKYPTRYKLRRLGGKQTKGK